MYVQYNYVRVLLSMHYRKGRKDWQQHWKGLKRYLHVHVRVLMEFCWLILGECMTSCVHMYVCTYVCSCMHAWSPYT